MHHNFHATCDGLGQQKRLPTSCQLTSSLTSCIKYRSPCHSKLIPKCCPTALATYLGARLLAWAYVIGMVGIKGSSTKLPRQLTSSRNIVSLVALECNSLSHSKLIGARRLVKAPLLTTSIVFNSNNMTTWIQCWIRVLTNFVQMKEWKYTQRPVAYQSD